MTRLFALPLLALGSVALASQDDFQSKCTQFGHKIDLPDVKVNFAQFLKAGTNLTLPNDPSCETPSQNVTVDLCRVAMGVTTSNSSEITLEAWFPRDYKGRFLSTGNGGLGGCIQYDDLAYAAQMGFASVGANNGHNGTSGKPFYEHPEVLKDFVYRSLHTGVVKGKNLTTQFYDQGFNKSYYLGCSTGGRQGWGAIQRYPNDFDGVVVGAPALNFVNLISWGGKVYPSTGPPGSKTFLTQAEWKIVHKEIIRQCDPIDGAKDGIIEDPTLCQPVLETLVCGPNVTSSCLTSTKVQAAENVLGPLYGENGTMLYPRMQPGSELYAAPTVYTGQPFKFSRDWLKYVVYDPSYNATKWKVHDAEVALAQNPYNVQTFEGDLSPFKKAGGKVLHYHGLQDQLVSSEGSKLYYRHVAKTMDLPPYQLDEFYRFFPISGMSHCALGDGASAIGQKGLTYAGKDPQDNVLMATVRWVEEGIAPEHVRGSKLTNGTGSKVEYRRKHCRYPRHNVFKGPGNYTSEDAWQCV